MSRARDIADLSSVSARLDTVGGSEGALSNRNIILNGAMQVWQRGTSTTTVTSGTYETVDRFKFWESTDGAYTIEQSTDVPSGKGFAHSVKLAVTTADTSLGASQYSQFAQRIEAFNVQQLAYGTSEAKTVTVSFWIKSNKTGSYGFNLFKNAAGNTGYIYHKSFSIDAADTWEKKIITVTPTAGSTSFITSSGGAIDPASTSGLEVYFNLAMGSTFSGATDDSWSSDTNDYNVSGNVNWMDSTSNNLYITGVQLEVGDTATDFEHRSFGDELVKCERYFQTYSKRNWQGTNEHSGNYKMYLDGVFRQKMRAAPTATFVGTVTIGRPQVGVSQRPDSIGGLSTEGFQDCGWPSSGTYGGSLGTHGDAYYRMAVGDGPTNRIDFDAEL